MWNHLRQSENRPLIVENRPLIVIVLALEAGKEIIRGVYRKFLSIRSRFLR